MEKPNKVGADLPWWFHLYHAAWLAFLVSMFIFLPWWLAALITFFIMAYYATTG